MTSVVSPALPVRPRSFAWHLGLLTLGLVLPALIFVAILVVRFATVEKQRIEGEAQVLARTLALTVAQRLNERIATLQALATSPNLRTNDLAEFYRQMKALQEQQGQNFGLREPRGEVLLSTRVPYGQPIPRTDGAVRAADEAALATRAPYVSDVYFGPISRMANITIAVPVLQHDPPRMVVGASLDVSTINDLLKSFTRPEGWSIGLTDRTFTVVARIPEVTNLAGSKASAAFQSQAQSQSGRYQGVNPVGTASVIVFDTVPGLDWRVAVSIPREEVDGLLWRSIVALAVIGLSLGGIGALLASAMQRRLARSVAAVGALAATFRDQVPATPVTSPVREIAEVSEALMNASRELRDNEARFRGVFDSSVMGFSIFDANTGTTLAINDRFLAMTGHSRADFDEGRWDWRSFTPPEFLPLDEEAIRQARERGWWQSYEKDYLRRDGTRFPVRISSAPLNGAPGRVVVAIEDISEEARAREAVARSEALARAQAEELASIYHAAPVGLCVLDRDLRYVRINALLAEINGIPAADHIGRSVREVVPDISDQAFQAMQRVLAGEEIRGLELSGTTAAQPGVVRTWRENWLPLRDASGEIVGVTASAEEITETKAAAAALHESEQRFRNMADHSPAMMWVTDPDAHCTYLNRAWYEFTGQTEEQAAGFGWLEAVHPEDRGWSGETFLAANASREAFRLEYRLRRADGVYRWAIDAASPRFGLSGEFLGFIGSVVDIHDRKVAETMLQQRVDEALAQRREADALYRTYFENTPEALFVIGVEPDGGFVVEEINPAHEAGVGMKLAEIRGRRIEEILPKPVADRVLETYRHVVRTGTTHQYREQFDLGGEPQQWDTSLVPMRDDEGRIVRLIGSSRNVTRQVVAEEALRQSQKMEAMGQLTGGVAHDFNNLLTPIVGTLDMMLRRGVGNERERRLISGAAQAAERARVLVQRLLAFARRQPLQAVAVDVEQLVTGMAQLISSTTGPQIKVVVQVDKDLPPAKADPNQLEMALLNLAVNARDAMLEGGILRITVEAETVEQGHRAGLKPGRYLHLSVSDTGSGMDEATLARAIEPFFSTKGVGKGTGLGLSMVHGLASQLGGALTIRSAPGLGTNVEMWLQAGAEGTAPGDPAPEPRTAPGGAEDVLLVDDEEVVRHSTADMLAELGYNVIEASSAEDAMSLVKQGLRPGLVVTDHLMPGMSGTDLARALKDERPELKVLIVSGYAETAGVAPDLPRLAKPFRKDDLAASLAELAGAGSTSSAGTPV
jgi:PAS domain S-box-containing protein